MPTIKFFNSLGDCAKYFASEVENCLRDAIDVHGQASLAVSGGRTPEHIFPLLAEKPLPWERVSITLADERWVDQDHPDSNERLARIYLMRGPASQARFIGLKKDFDSPFDGLSECETSLTDMPWPLDLLYLGMGEDGHIASLFPGEEDWGNASGRALAVPASRIRNPRMSLTPQALLDSRHIFLVITGPDKRVTFDAAMKPGPVGEYPVRLILHQTKVPVTVYAVD